MTNYAFRAIERGFIWDKASDAITPWGTDPRTGRGLNANCLGLPGARDPIGDCTRTDRRHSDAGGPRVDGTGPEFDSAALSKVDAAGPGIGLFICIR
jgi:hypothetical protein